MSHLSAQGDDDGKRDYKVGTEDEKKASWEELLKKGAKKSNKNDCGSWKWR